MIPTPEQSQQREAFEKRISELEAENKVLRECPANRDLILAVEDICRVAGERMIASVKAALATLLKRP
jgi:hypothetical protein